MLRLGSAIEQLLLIRERMGWLYGSEDLCVLLYSIVKRERPSLIIELGTGLGVSTAWMAAALKENARGLIHTYDNGSHYLSDPSKRFLADMDAPISELASATSGGITFEGFIGNLMRWVGVEEHVVVHHQDIQFQEVARDKVFLQGIDLLFSDFNHAPENIQKLLGAFLPSMAPTSSIFIDSASTHRLSYLALERIVADLNRNKLPVGLTEHLSDEQFSTLARRVQGSHFRMMHLVETHSRAQNSTAWLRIEPVDIVPTNATFFH